MKRAEIETQNLRMEQVQKMNLLGQLSGEIAHDFNNILCGIMGYTDLMLENKPDEENRKMLNSILEASLRGEHLIQQILLFGRKKEIKLIEGKLGLVVQDVFSFIRPSFPPSVEIILKLEKEESSILLEPYKIHECLLNICTNSLHAMDKKGVLTIQLKHHEIKSRELGLLGSLKKGDYRVIEVSDTGRGIPQDQLSKIFEPYFTTKDIGEGTGLGLSVVYGVMEQHGGNIKIHSAVGEGSTITLFFPL
jgi:signal transduction histidine kinase